MSFFSVPIFARKNISFKINCCVSRTLVKFKITRNICNDVPEDQEKNPIGGLKKEKIIIFRKVFPTDPSKPAKILNYRKASDVLRRWNAENKQLFGPIQYHKHYLKQDIQVQNKNVNEYIQHRTSLPIKEPQIKSEINHKSAFISNKNHLDESIQTFDFRKVLEFPLINKSKGRLAVQNEINELNILRKYLESKIRFSIPSVTSILDKTMPKESKEALERWKKNMIEQLGQDGFNEYKKELLKTGSSLHASINSYLSATPESDINIEECNQGHWKSLKAVFPNISEVKLLEEKVSHPFLCYKGVVDCFAQYNNQLVVIDWKTSKKSKSSLSSTFDNPLQIAAYVGALNFDPKFQYLANKGLIIIAYENGNPANVHFMNEEKMLQYWKEWLKRIKLYWESFDSMNN